MIVSRNSQFGIVVAYIPSADTTTLINIITALGRFPNRNVIIVGNLNLDLGSIELGRERDADN